MDPKRDQEIMSVFLAVTGMPSAQRQSYLNQVCRDDIGLRNELETLLRHHHAKSLIHNDHSCLMVELMELPLKPVQEDRYEIGAEIARGGMGSILLAQDNQIGRRVAIKVLVETLQLTPDVLERFVAEAQIAGQLQHPGIAPVYEIGRLPNGQPFFAMKLVDGRTLSSLLDRRASPNAEHDRLIGIFGQVCQAVAYAHSRGVIHRDLKPANIMVGEFGEVQVMDWGLAKVLSTYRPEDGTNPTLDHMQSPQTVRSDTHLGRGADTHLGSLIGTPCYASPEQAKGEMDRVDRRSDVFSLGAILCEILTARPPNNQLEDSDETNGIEDPSPGETELRLDDCNADIELVQLAKQCLVSNPNGRLADAGVVAEFVSEYQHSVQSRLRDAELASARAEAKAVEEKKRRLVSIGLTISILLLCLVGVSSWIWINSQQRRNEIQVTQNINDALTDAIRLRGLADADPLINVESWHRAREAAERAAELANQSKINSKLKARVIEELDSLKIETANRQLLSDIEQARVPPDDAMVWEYGEKTIAKRFESAFKAYGVDPSRMKPELAVQTIRERSGELIEPMTTIVNQWFLVSFRGAKGQRNQDAMVKWIRRTADLLDEDPWRGQWREAVSQEEANELLRVARDPSMLERSVGDQVNLAHSLSTFRAADIALVIDCVGKMEERNPRSIWLKFWLTKAIAKSNSRKLVQKGVRFSQALVALYPVDSNRVLHASLLRTAHELNEAEAELKSVLDTNPNQIAARYELAKILMAQSKWQLALDQFDKIEQGRPDETTVRSPRGQALLKLGRFSEAEKEFMYLVENRPNDSFRHYENLGKTYLASAQYDKAITAFENVNPKQASACLNLAKAYLAKNQLVDAVPWIQTAIEFEPSNAQPYYLLGSTQWTQQDWGAAADTYRRGFENDADANSRVGLLAKAARCAMRASISESNDDQLNDFERRQFRQLARTWMQVAVDHNAKFDELPKWETEALWRSFTAVEFSSVRNETQLANLPEAERKAWNLLWEKADAQIANKNVQVR